MKFLMILTVPKNNLWAQKVARVHPISQKNHLCCTVSDRISEKYPVRYPAGQKFQQMIAYLR